jgi:hypothetical protein
MHLTIASTQGKTKRRPPVQTSAMQRFAIEEIDAYIAVRDSLLREAEEKPSTVTLARIKMANEFVTNCLRPAQQPYILQAYPDLDAVRALKRCHAIGTRLIKLQAALVAAA